MCRSRRFLNVLAGISLVLGVYTGLAWASRLLPHRFELPVRFSWESGPQGDAYMQGGYNYVYFVSSHPIAQPIVGPKLADRDARAAFENSFPYSAREYRSFAVGGGDYPSFSANRDGNVIMTGRESRFEIGFGYFPLVFLSFPISLWLPPMWRRRKIERRFCPHCGAVMA